MFPNCIGLVLECPDQQAEVIIDEFVNKYS